MPVAIWATGEADAGGTARVGGSFIVPTEGLADDLSCRHA